MRGTITRSGLTTMVAGIAVLAALTAPASAVTRAGTDGGEFAEVSSVSCPSAGNCAAVGEIYGSSPGINSVFVVNQTKGTWGRQQQVKGLAALPKGGARNAQLNAVSCSSPGNCLAGGDYSDAQTSHPFVVTETKGTWGNARAIALPRIRPGLTIVNEVDNVSCQAAGDCTATGQYWSNSDGLPFVVSEHNGTWSKAEELPGTATLSRGAGGGIEGLSCASAGNCAVGGYYLNADGDTRPFVATQTSGTWGNAQEVPGTAAVSKGTKAGTVSVSCPAPGRCLAVGYYESSGDDPHPFISSQKNGVWGHIQPVPGLAKLSGGDVEFPLMQWGWCASPGNCTAVGNYAAHDGYHNFDVTERNGAWGNARKIRLGARFYIKITAISCASLGNCSAGGWFQGTNSQEVFVITETNGTWGKSEQVPGSVKLNHGGNANLSSLSCGAPGDCTAGGNYSPKSRVEEPMLVTQKDGVWGNAMEVPGLP